MTKLKTFILLFVLCLSMAACGSSEAGTKMDSAAAAAPR
jgi:uncharacterized lipoprotein YehR (DUF1307 family)